MRRTAKLVSVSVSTIQDWIEHFAAVFAAKPKPIGRAIVIELDEMWHDVQNKSNKLWIWKADERSPKRLVDWEYGDRDEATAQRWIERLRA